MSQQTRISEQTQIKKIIIGIIGILFLFYLVSCNSTEDTSPEDALPLPKATPPSAVGDLTVASFTTNQVVLSWTAPTNTGTVYGTNATLSGYLVKYKTADSEFIEIDEKSEGVRLTAALTANSSNATVIGLGPGTYTFLVAAVNSGDQVTPDAESSTVDKTIILPPDNLKQTQCDKATSADLAWDASTGATSYKVYRDGAEITSITTTSYTDTGLTAGTRYIYNVRACKDADCSNDSNSLEITTITLNDKSFKSIIEAHEVPADLSGYDERSREIFSRYTPNACVVAKYLKPSGTGDGSSFDKAAGNLKSVLTNITNASANQVYAVLLTGGTYRAGSSMAMKNHVAIIGGVDEDLGSSETVTALDGEESYGVFRHNNNGLNNTALLYGVTITNGKTSDTGNGGGMDNERSSPSLVGVTFSGNSAEYGGGMVNRDSSPSLVEVTFSENKANNDGGGMVNWNSSPSLERVTFSGNTANRGGGIYNTGSSPSLVGVTFSGNTADEGGGMYNYQSSLILVGVTFSGNTADEGGGMYNYQSSPILEGVTFSGNSATTNGGGMYNEDYSSPSLVGVTFSENSAVRGGGMYNENSSPSLVGVTFFENTANANGGGMYNNNGYNGGTPLIINGIFWSNTAPTGPQFYFYNENTAQENLRIYNSIVQGGTGTLVSGATTTSVNQGGFVSDVGTVPVVISFSNISDQDPGLLPLVDNGGSVLTHAILSDSPAVNKGLYVKKKLTTVNIRKEYTYYYSKDNTTWYTEPDLSGTSVTPPADAEDVTDATGYTRTDRPDLGAYEAR